MIRLQKFLSNIGYASRRKCEKIILNKKAKINGRIAKIGDKVTIGDKIEVESDKFIFTKNILDRKIKLLAYHKRIGEIVSRETDYVNNTVFSYLPKEDFRWINIGRLDVATSGLILFTNSGHIANKLMHPSANIERVYLVTLKRSLTNKEKNLCLSGIDIGKNEKGKLSSVVAKSLSDFMYEISLKTGKNREVRRLFKKINHDVQSLIRTEYGNYKLDKIKNGCHKYLSDEEIDLLLD